MKIVKCSVPYWERVVWERIYPDAPSGPRYIIRGGLKFKTVYRKAETT